MADIVKRGEYFAKVGYNRRIGEGFYKIGLEFEGAGAEAFGELEPGQFAELDLSKTAIPESIPEGLRDSSMRDILLRRPFGFSDVTFEGGVTKAEILYRTVGPASLRMMTFCAGETVSVIGPLGRGFWIEEGKRKAMVVIGGMGAGPLIHLAKVIRERKPAMEVTVFAGARSKKNLPFENVSGDIGEGEGMWLEEFAQINVKSFVVTEDGSAGSKGFVTDGLSKRLAGGEVNSEDLTIYACGPEGMLAKVTEIANEKGISCQVSMERRMACGIGICQSCAVESKVDGYKLCCQDGPVFDSAEVLFSE